MSLFDKLEALTDEASVRKCKLVKLMDGDKFNDVSRSKLNAILAEPIGKPGRVTNTDIAKLLRSEGFDIADAAVDRHRRRACRCFTSPQGTE